MCGLSPQSQNFRDVEPKFERMTKAKAVILVLLAGLVSLVSFGTANNKDAETGVNRGDVLKNESSDVQELAPVLKQNKGNYVLVNFWASYDAESHIANINLANLVSNYNAQNKNEVKLVSVSLDRFQSVADETLRRDGLVGTQNLTVTQGFNSRMAQSLELTEGEFSNFLLDPQGVIVGKNLTKQQVAAFLAQMARRG